MNTHRSEDAFKQVIPPVAKKETASPGSKAAGKTKARKGKPRQQVALGISPLSKIGGYAGAIIAALVIALPLYFVVITSLKNHADIYADPIKWVPSVWVPQNFSYVWDTLNFDQYLMNSVIITSILVVIKVSLGGAQRLRLCLYKIPRRQCPLLLGDWHPDGTQRNHHYLQLRPGLSAGLA